MEGHLDFNNFDRILNEYLGIDKDYIKTDSGKEMLKNTKKAVKKICEKYKGQDIEYIFESDYIVGRASGLPYYYDTSYPLAINYMDVEFVEDIDGIVVYRKKGSDK